MATGTFVVVSHNVAAGDSDQSRDCFDSFINEDSEYHKMIDQTEIWQLKVK